MNICVKCGMEVPAENIKAVNFGYAPGLCVCPECADRKCNPFVVRIDAPRVPSKKNAQRAAS